MENQIMEQQETIGHQRNRHPVSKLLLQPVTSTVRSIVYLLLSFPLGLIFFLITIIGFSCGIGTLVIWIGLPILFGTLFTVRTLAEVERRMVSNLLHVHIPYQLPGPPEPRLGLLKSFVRMLGDPYTWTSMVFMILKLPLGIFNFTLTLVLTTFSATLTLLPLVYMMNVLVSIILVTHGISGTGYIIPGFIEVHGYFDPIMFFRSFIGVPVGIVTWAIASPLLNGLAQASGELARALLGPGTASPTARLHTQE